MTDRFTEFLKSLEADTYPEPPSQIHEEITARVLPEVVAKVRADGQPLRVLDVGCGQGVALKRFNELGCCSTGITTNEEDARIAGALLPNPVFEMDMHDILEGDATFDLIWARHVLEHSPAPLFALREFWRVLKPGGWLYLEMPAPDTSCSHHLNKNHYSVFGASAWMALIEKGGFKIQESNAWHIQTQAGPDVYFSFLSKKP